MALLLDSGVVYAYYDADDDWHDQVRSLLDGAHGPLIVPAGVIPEVDHLLGVRIGHRAQLALYDDLVAGVYPTVDLEAERYARVAELNRRYADLAIGFVNGAVAALFEQLGVRRLATIDRRQFRRSATTSNWSSCRTRRVRGRLLGGQAVARPSARAAVA